MSKDESAAAQDGSSDRPRLPEQSDDGLATAADPRVRLSADVIDIIYKRLPLAACKDAGVAETWLVMLRDQCLAALDLARELASVSASYEACVTAIKADLAEARKDAERYRWLRAGKDNIMIWGRYYGGGEPADRAVDAAIIEAAKERA